MAYLVFFYESVYKTYCPLYKNIQKEGMFFMDNLVIDDLEHSEQEERFIILGFSKKANLLVVCHCYRESDSIIRIISARKATTTEIRFYHES